MEVGTSAFEGKGKREKKTLIILQAFTFLLGNGGKPKKGFKKGGKKINRVSRHLLAKRRNPEGLPAAGPRSS